MMSLMLTRHRDNLHIAFLCSLHLFCGPVLIILNKYILHSMAFPYPMFLAGMGVFVTGSSARLLVHCCRFATLQKKEHVEGWLWYKRVLPIGFAHASTMAFGNIVYLYLNVGTVQMLKSFGPVVVLAVGCLYGIDKIDLLTLLFIVVICFGTAMTCSYTLTLTLAGVICMLLSELFEAIRLVFTQYFLQNLRFGVVESMYLLAPASAFWLLTASMAFEMPSMIKTHAIDVLWTNPLVFIVAASLGLAINSLSFLVIQHTSSVTMKVLATFRGIITITLGVVFYDETVTVQEMFGYAIALLGFIGYNLAKLGMLDHWRVQLAKYLNNNSNNNISDNNFDNNSNVNTDVYRDDSYNGWLYYNTLSVSSGLQRWLKRPVLAALAVLKGLASEGLPLDNKSPDQLSDAEGELEPLHRPSLNPNSNNSRDNKLLYPHRSQLHIDVSSGEVTPNVSLGDTDGGLPSPNRLQILPYELENTSVWY